MGGYIWAYWFCLSSRACRSRVRVILFVFDFLLCVCVCVCVCSFCFYFADVLSSTMWSNLPAEDSLSSRLSVSEALGI